MNTTISVNEMHHAAHKACGLLRVLSNEDRLLLLCQLTAGERCVSELEQTLGIQQPTLSQQLGVLRKEGVVSTRRDGKNIYYQIDSPQALGLLQTLHALFCSYPAKKQRRKS